MKRISLAVAGAAVVGLAACSNTAAPSAAPASHSHGTVSVPVSCAHQYNAWRHGQGKGLVPALRRVSAAERAGDSQALRVALRRARPAVARAARHPIPACADPRGYWSVLLMHVNAAATSESSTSSVRAAMKDVPKIEHNLIAEVRHAVSE